MNRQILILIVSIILVVFCGIWEIKYLENSSRFCLTDIEYSQNTIKNNDFNLAKTNIEEIKKTWSSMKTIWNIFVEHSEVDNIEETLVEYKVYVENENKEEALRTSEILKRYFYHVVERQRLCIDNVF
ncbi:MAG: DUF4363 family protein [Clostridia bacterium]